MNTAAMVIVPKDISSKIREIETSYQRYITEFRIPDDHKIVVNFSAGKGSTATATIAHHLFGDRVQNVMADTDNEHELTIEFGRTIHEQIGCAPVKIVKRIYTQEEFDARRLSLKKNWSKRQAIRSGAYRGVLMPSLSRSDTPFGRAWQKTAERWGIEFDTPLEAALSVLHPSGNSFLDAALPEYMARQQELQTGQIDNVADLRTELSANLRRADELDATLQQRTTEYQGQRMKFKEARRLAQKDIDAEKAQLAARNEEINQALERNAAAELARGRQAQLSRGEIPDDLKVTIAERAQQIRDGMQMSPVAGAVRTAASAIREADWTVNQQAYRAALAHMMEGRSPDVEPFYELHKPALRERAIQRIQNPVRQVDETARPVSETADRVYQETQKADHELTAAAADLENEFNISNALLDDIAVDNPELAATMRENLNAIRAEASDNSMSNAFRAFAACMINRGI